MSFSRKRESRNELGSGCLPAEAVRAGFRRHGKRYKCHSYVASGAPFGRKVEIENKAQAWAPAFAGVTWCLDIISATCAPCSLANAGIRNSVQIHTRDAATRQACPEAFCWRLS
jgi:hypothetical protein